MLQNAIIQNFRRFAKQYFSASCDETVTNALLHEN